MFPFAKKRRVRRLSLNGGEGGGRTIYTSRRSRQRTSPSKTERGKKEAELLWANFSAREGSSGEKRQLPQRGRELATW